MPFENVVFGGHQIQCGGDNLNSVPRNFNLDAFWNDPHVVGSNGRPDHPTV